MSTLISVIICAYNEEKHIAENIESLRRQGGKGVLELIVINDASTDRTGEICRRYASKNLIRLVDKKTKEGQWKGIADGIRLSRGKLIAKIDGDSYPCQGWVKKVAKIFGDENVIAAGGPQKTLNRTYLSLAGDALEQVLVSSEKRVESENRVLAGSGMVFRKSILKEVGGIDSTRIWGEDEDLALRLVKYAKKTGKKIVFDPRLSVFTEYPETLKAEALRHLKWGYGKYLIIKKHGTEKNFVSKILLMSILIASMFLNLWLISILAILAPLFLILVTPNKSMKLKYVPGAFVLGWTRTVCVVIGFIVGALCFR